MAIPHCEDQTLEDSQHVLSIYLVHDAMSTPFAFR